MFNVLMLYYDVQINQCKVPGCGVVEIQWERVRETVSGEHSMMTLWKVYWGIAAYDT